MYKPLSRPTIFLLGPLAWTLQASAITPPPEVTALLRAGQLVDLIVEYDDSAIVASVAAMRITGKVKGADQDPPAVRQFKTQEYQSLKDRVDRAAERPSVGRLKDYSHLPMAFKRFTTESDLTTLLANPGVKAVYTNRPFKRVLAQSLPLINQPAVSAAGAQGNGTTVAVIDDGIDFTKSAFGSCTAPGVPVGCRVTVSQNFGTGTTDTSHGTNVSAIVLGVAPASRIAMLNAFSGGSAFLSDIISAMNWAIANQAAYNLVAINMSLGDGNKYTSPCSAGNPFLTPVTNARNAGMQVVVAAGNEAYTNGLSSPACTPGAISVGAVYDANYGGLNWGSTLCTDATTAADQVTCFSNSANFLTLLAPGALITAADITEGGTSQATPHVAGAVAVLRALYPAENLSQIQARMTGSAVSIADPRNGIAKPRLNLLQAARPSNDGFASRITLSGSSGNSSSVTLFSTREAGEPNHAGNNTGSKSVWWRWTAPAAGQLTLDTHGSGFDTLLAVYTGTGVAALTPVAASDNDGTAGGASGLVLQTQAGQEYEVAVDGASGAAGTAVVNWALNTAANANLSAGISGPGIVSVGASLTYTLTVSNAGPQSATHILVIATLPPGATYASSPAGCTVSGSTVTCLVGSLANGATVLLPIGITWNTITGPVSIAVNVNSDVPDAASGNNAATIVVALDQSGDTDAPTLPQWGVLLLGTLLVASSGKKKAAERY